MKDMIHDAYVEAFIELKKDGYYSSSSEFGGTKDPAERMQYVSDSIITHAMIDVLYRTSWVAQKAIRMLPDSSMGKGYVFEIPGNENQSVAARDEAKRLRLNEKILQAQIISRAHGGALLYAGALDGQETWKPLDKNGIKTISGLKVFSNWEADVYTWYEDPSHPKYGQPETYQITPYLSVSTQSYIIHESRFISRYDGSYVMPQTLVINDGWHDSFFQKINRSLRDYGVASQSGAQIIQDFVTKVMQVTGLAQKVSDEEQKEAIKTRIKHHITTSSNFGMSIIDAEESFSKISTSISGLPEMLQIYMRIVASAADIDYSILFGETLGQLSGAQAARDNWFDKVKTYQDNFLLEKLQDAYNYIFMSRGFNSSAIVPEYSITFNPLKQPTQKEIWEAEKMKAETYNIYIQSQVLTPSEVAEGEFSDPELNPLNVKLSKQERKEQDDLQFEEDE